jgi:hypothetical protein
VRLSLRPSGAASAVTTAIRHVLKARRVRKFDFKAIEWISKQGDASGILEVPLLFFNA